MGYQYNVRTKYRTIEELCRILREHNTVTVCSLPHYRFQSNWRNIRTFEHQGLVGRSGSTPESVNFVKTELFKTWQSEFESGATTHYPLNWLKLRKKTGHDLI